MAEVRINPLLMGEFAIALGIISFAFWIIQYFIAIDAIIIIAVICPCTIFGLILALSHDSSGEAPPSIHRLQKIGLIINLGFVGYLILSPILIAIIEALYLLL